MSRITFDKWNQQRLSVQRLIGRNTEVYNVRERFASDSYDREETPSRCVENQIKAKIGSILKLGRSISVGDKIKVSQDTIVIFLDVRITAIGPMIMGVIDNGDIFVGRIEEVIY